MQLLTVLTLIYVAVLVLVLAGSLIAILVHLWRIEGVLRDVRNALERVQEETKPLNEPLDSLYPVAADIAQQMDQARLQLKKAEEHLEALFEKSGPAGVER